jgi:hypothetical protein
MHARKNFLGVAYSLETVFEKLFVVWDAYELFVFIVFGLEKAFFYEYFRAGVRSTKGLEPSRVVIMAVADDESLDFSNIDSKRLGVLQEPVTLSRIKKETVSAVLDVEGKPMLGTESAGIHDILDKHDDFHSGPLWQCGLELSKA